MSGTNETRVSVLGRSVDETPGGGNAANAGPGEWIDAGSQGSRNTLNTAERIPNRAINYLNDQLGLIDAATSGFNDRFNDVIGEDSGTDQAAFQQIGKNLIQAVAELVNGGGTGPGGGTGDVTQADLTQAIEDHDEDPAAHDDIRAAIAALGSTGGAVTTLAGDVTGQADATVVARMRGRDISPTAPTANQFLQYQGTAWTPVTVNPGAGMNFTSWRSLSTRLIFGYANSPADNGTFIRGGCSHPHNSGSFVLAGNNHVYSNSSEITTSAWTDRGESPVSFATGYMGLYCHFWYGESTAAAASTAEPRNTIIFFNKTNTALRVDTRALTYTALALNGIPSGIEPVAIHGSGYALFMISNNQVWRWVPPAATTQNMSGATPSWNPHSDAALFPATAITFTQVTNAHITNLGTITRVYVCGAQRAFTTLADPAPTHATIFPQNQYRVLLWGTTEPDKFVLYDSITDTWQTLETPEDHNGGANALLITNEGRLCFLAPSTRNFYTCYPFDATNPSTNLELRYTVPTSNRRLARFGDVVYFFASASSATIDVDAYKDLGSVAQNNMSGVAETNNTLSIQFGAEVLSGMEGNASAFSGLAWVLPSTSNAGRAAPFGRWASTQNWAQVFDDQQTFVAIRETTSLPGSFTSAPATQGAHQAVPSMLPGLPPGLGVATGRKQINTVDVITDQGSTTRTRTLRSIRVPPTGEFHV